MAKITSTITRQDTTKSWFKIDANTMNSMFTTEEVKILADSVAYLKKLPGYVKNTYTTVNENVANVVIEFDTPENLQNYISLRETPTTILYQRENLIKNKKTELGINYTYSSVIE